MLIFVKSEYGVERKDIYSILRLNRRAKVVKIAVFGNGKFCQDVSGNKTFAIYLWREGPERSSELLTKNVNMIARAQTVRI